MFDITTLTDRGHINLRGNPKNVAFLAKCEEILGQALPVLANKMTIAVHHIYWLGPDEWLISSPEQVTKEVLLKLKSELQEYHCSINDLSGGQLTIQLEGSHVRDVLSKGCTLDFHRREFKTLDCAQSGMGKAIALFGKISDGDKFELIVRRTFYEYLISWLQQAKDLGLKNK